MAKKKQRPSARYHGDRENEITVEQHGRATQAIENARATGQASQEALGEARDRLAKVRKQPKRSRDND
jgi:hypothetical protein